MTKETPVRAPFLAEDVLVLRLELGACRLRVAPGGDEPWVEGRYTDPTGDSSVKLQVAGGRLVVSQERTLAGTVGLVRGVPSCELRLGTARDYRLEVVTGASDVDLDLSGLPLRGVDVKAGAGKVALRATRPNPVDADEVSLRMGAGTLEAVGLGNLAAHRLEAESGAAALGLDLTGELRRPLDVRVAAGMSGVTLSVPADRAARISSDATLGGVDLGDGFRTGDGVVHTLAEGEPVITARATVALGGLQIRAVRA
jgi:hypothetical protein